MYLENLKKRELITIQGRNGETGSLPVYDDGSGKGCIPDPFKDIMDKIFKKI